MRRNVFLFVVGGAGYSMLEVLYRGRTTLDHVGAGRSVPDGAGGDCPCPSGLAAVETGGSGAAAITAAELAVGLVINCILGWNVWDYSSQPVQSMGADLPAVFRLLDGIVLRGVRCYADSAENWEPRCAPGIRSAGEPRVRETESTPLRNE